MLCHQILVQPYLLGFRDVVRVPTKETAFDASFFSNNHIHNNSYPAACDVMCGISKTEKTSSVSVHHKTGKVSSLRVLHKVSIFFSFWV